MDNINLSIPHKDLAPEGTYSWLYVVPEFDGEKVDDKKKLKDNEFRDFQIKALLNKFPSNSLSIDFQFDANKGNSYLLIPEQHEGQKILNLKLYTTFGEFLFFRNKVNELSLIEFNCQANNQVKAVEKFHRGITPYLDFLAYKYNVPVTIDKIFCLDTKHHITSISYTSPYLPKSAVLPPYGVPNEMIPIFALFREAINTTSPYYKFLCFFKIIEGIYRNLRPKVISKLKSKGLDVTIEKEVIPPLPEMERFKSKYIGNSIHTLFQSEFEKEYRHAISHFSLKDGSMLNLSDSNIIGKYENIIYLIEVSCRIVIKNQLELINRLHKV